MSQLVTLRLAIAADQSDALRRHPLLREAASPQRSVESLIYYDTSRHDLARQGLRLSLRRNGGGWVQIVTARPDVWPGLSRVHYWESPYLNLFDFSHIADEEIRRILQKPKVNDRLRAISECSFRRSTWLLEPTADVRVCAKLDRGWIAASGRRQQVSEMMLELDRGALTDLYDLALALAERVPVFPEGLSKAARGERLALGQARQPVKASALALDPATRSLAAFRAIALACLEQLHANREGAVNSDDPEYVHQMRVATRRLRAAMRMFKPVLPPEFVDAMVPALRELMSVLGRTRDLDVLITEIIAPVAAAMPGEPRLSALSAVVTEHLFQARRSAVALLDRPAYARLQLTAGRLLNAPPFLDAPAPEPVADATVTEPAERLTDFAERRLRRLLKSVRSLAAQAHTDDPGSLHALRIGIKRLRYAIEFFGALTPKRSGERIVRQLSALQEELGQLNDLANAGDILMTCAGNDTALREAVTLIGGWHGARYAALLDAIPAQLKVVDGLRLPRFTPRAED